LIADLEVVLPWRCNPNIYRFAIRQASKVVGLLWLWQLQSHIALGNKSKLQRSRRQSAVNPARADGVAVKLASSCDKDNCFISTAVVLSF
jgi:hypothetical protein